MERFLLVHWRISGIPGGHSSVALNAPRERRSEIPATEMLTATGTARGPHQPSRGFATRLADHPWPIATIIPFFAIRHELPVKSSPSSAFGRQRTSA